MKAATKKPIISEVKLLAAEIGFFIGDFAFLFACGASLHNSPATDLGDSGTRRFAIILATIIITNRLTRSTPFWRIEDPLLA